MRKRLALGLLVVGVCGAPFWAHAQGCSKSDFETVVDEAASTLTALNQKNTPQFQGKLRKLKEKRGWSNDQFMQQAAPLVRDDAIADFDRKSEELLADITNGGQSGASGAAPNCALLEGLRGQLRVLVDTQKAKWTYMFGKIEQELQK